MENVLLTNQLEITIFMILLPLFASTIKNPVMKKLFYWIIQFSFRPSK